MFTERVLVLRPLWFPPSVFVCLGESTPITHPTNDRALLMHLVVAILAQGSIPIVVPRHACRRGFAAFGSAVTNALPKTAPGGPAAWIDPTAEELQQNR